MSSDIKTLVAEFIPGRHVSYTKSVYRYDTGRVLKIEGLSLPAAYEVHFSNSPQNDAYVALGDENGAPIPDNVLRTSTDTVVYPTESLPNLSQLVDQVQAAIDSFPADLSAIQAAIAANYDDLTYPIAAGTYAWHAGTLYKAKTDISAAESWSAAHWKTVHAASDLAANVSQLKSALTEI